jgi:predicted transposase/invertase (TIGR01784 family)
MTVAEKNIREWIEELGIKEKIMEEGINKEKCAIARKMLKKGVSIDDIMDFTELPREEILKLRDTGE